MNVLPEPGFIEVSITTWCPPSNPSMNSRLVRTTRNASFMMLRLFSLTMSCVSVSSLVSCTRLLPFLCTVACGISPTNGACSDSMSLRPRTAVLKLSTSRSTRAGRPMPTRAAIPMTSGMLGLTGTGSDVGCSMRRVL